MSEWRLTVGMEVHIELETHTKMFCACKNDPFYSESNTNVCPVCYGLPGALPLLNKNAIEMTIRLGRALNGKIPETTFWARKNYFYPDLPKGYQISQSTAPLVEDAVVTIDGEDHHLERIHLEEDAGKLMHGEGGKSLVDYNRAGVPLMEIVTRPDFHSAEAAKRFCQELQRIVRSMGISSADMEKGQMRCEANISVSQSDELGTKVEVKNINSFRSVERAIEHEFERQVELLEAGKEVLPETRTWNDQKSATVAMRSKETSADYRYFPEPDLPMVRLPKADGAEKHLLPEAQRKALQELGVAKDLIQKVLDSGSFSLLSDLAATAATKQYLPEAAKLLVQLPHARTLSPSDLHEFLAATASFPAETKREALESVVEKGRPLKEVLLELHAASSGLDLGAIAEQVLSEHPNPVADYKAGKEAALNFLVGQVMAKTKGRVNVADARAELLKLLG